MIRRAFNLLGHITGHPANRGAKLAAAWRLVRWQFIKHLFGRSLVVEIGDGRRFKILPDSKFSSLVYYNRLPDWDEMNFLLRVLRPEDGFIDIGANVGFYSVLAARRVAPARVHAVEANPANVAVLREQIVLNRMDGMTVFPVALGAANARLRFQANDRETGGIALEGAAKTFEVECRRLDELLAPAALPADTLGKIDVEGYEVEVFRGARELLASHVVAAWLFEFSEDNLRRQKSSGRELLAAFKDNGYEFFLWSEDELRLTRVDPECCVSANYIACCRGAGWLQARLAQP